MGISIYTRPKFIQAFSLLAGKLFNLTEVFPQNRPIPIVPERVISTGEKVILKKEFRIHLGPGSALSREYLGKLLQEMGFNPVFAKNEKSAVSYAQNR